MIVIEEEEDLLKAHVYGEFQLDDFRELERAVTGELTRYEQVLLLLDLRAARGFTVDVALEEIQFNRRHLGDYRRIAVVTDSQWLAFTSWLAGMFTGAEVSRFATLEDAEAWLRGLPAPG